MRAFARVALAALAAASACLACASAAVAEPGPIKLVSQTPSEQAQEAISPALSADGRYLAFQGTIGGQQGVFREELSSGAIALVAAMSGNSAAPSIVADGRYISFTTSVKLDPVNDTNFVADVYVADMSTSPPTYELVSALDGCDPAQAVAPASCGLTYEGPGGSEASGRVALSADGRSAVFVTAAVSNLSGTPGDTPAGQVVLRNLATHRTVLVSVERDSETGEMTAHPVPGGAELNGGLLRLSGAALSADGTTVAWMGAHLPAQVPLLSDEQKKISELDALNTYPYVEPLWRRIASGPQAPTRRITGGGDPLAFGCPPDGTLGNPACQGPFPALTNGKPNINGAATGWLGINGISGVPRLSADGNLVALIGNPVAGANVYLVDMAGGLRRRQATRELTREVSVSAIDPTAGFDPPGNVPLNGHVFDLAISPDGNRIVFATARQQFPLSPPNLVTPAPAQVGMAELYMIDLSGETVQRLTHGDGGSNEASLVPGFGPTRDGTGATAPSIDASGHLVAFASTASNLVPGDGNDASDAFVVEDGEASRVPAASIISPGPRRPRMRRPKGMTLSAVSLPGGAVRLQAIVPSAGALRADVSASLDAGARPRSLASDRTRERTGGAVRLRLRLPSRLRRLAHTREGLYAMARVSFHRRKGRALHGEIQVHFHAHGKHGGRR